MLIILSYIVSKHYLVQFHLVNQQKRWHLFGGHKSLLNLDGLCSNAILSQTYLSKLCSDIN